MNTSPDAELTKLDGVFVFWKYDLYPYVLGGEATKLRKDGAVYVPSYQGWFTNPIRFTTLEHGKELLARIKKTEQDYNRARKALEREWIEIVREVSEGMLCASAGDR